MVLTVLPEDEAALATLYDIHQHSPLKVRQLTHRLDGILTL